MHSSKCSSASAVALSQPVEGLQFEIVLADALPVMEWRTAANAPYVSPNSNGISHRARLRGPASARSQAAAALAACRRPIAPSTPVSRCRRPREEGGGGRQFAGLSGLSTSASRCLNGGDIDFPHCHHRFEDTSGLAAASGERIG